mgnify:CR=1 FL=1
MDGKVPETMYLRNKKAPKVLNSGTPEVSNHLVRMRSAVQIRPAAPENPAFPVGKAGFFLYFSTFPADLKFEIQT